jgi:uncharacterized protein (DUF1697 family)
MEVLRDICESLGHTQVQTYIQSGNVVFRSREKNASRLALRIGSAIEESAGFASDVVLRTREELDAVVARNPFASRTDIPPDRLVVTFFDRQPEPDAVRRVNAMKLPPEEFQVLGRELYVFFPQGMGRSKFPAVSIGKNLQASGTARNWNTVLKLLEMAANAETLDI